MRFYRLLSVGLLLGGMGGLPETLAAWTPGMQRILAEEAAWHAPPDLYRQIDRHRDWYLEGVRAPFESGEAERHVKNPDGSGVLDRVIEVEVQTAIEGIRSHQPFHQVVFRLGVVSHYMADANNPLNASDADPRERELFADYLDYMESVEPRVPLVFYGLTPGVHHTVRPLVDQALARSRRFYPLIGREYRRIEFGSGRERFDDKSTAFAVAAASFSQAVTDIVQVFRHIWTEAGGADRRALPEKGTQVVHLPRYDPERHGPPPALPRLPLAPPPPDPTER